jgi:hypothetical protein
MNRKNAVFLDVKLFGSGQNRRFGRLYRHHHQGNMNRQARITFLRSVLRLLVTANVVPSSPIHITLIMEAMRFFETSVPTRATRINIPGDGILPNQCFFIILTLHFLF